MRHIGILPYEHEDRAEGEKAGRADEVCHAIAGMGEPLGWISEAEAVGMCPVREDW